MFWTNLKIGRLSLANLEGWRKNPAGELMSGFTVAVVALPLALAFGVAAFGPLGPAYGALGAGAGLMGAAFTGILASLFGGCASQVTGPTGPMSMVARSTLAALVASPVLVALPAEEQATAALWLFGSSVVLGGLFQWLLAWSRLGNLVRGLPYPVVAGFMNGVSLLILLDQIRPALGWSNKDSWMRLVQGPWPVEVLVALGAGVVTALLSVLIPRWNKKVPAAFLALLLGTGFYYLLAWFFHPAAFDTALNPRVVGPIPSVVPLPTLILGLGRSAHLLGDGAILNLVLQQALVLGLLGTIDTLLTSVIADLRSGQRHSSNRELFGQGLGNLVSGLFGGLPGAGATVRTLANIDAGGRTGLSGAFHGVVILLVLLFFGPVFQYVPLPVLGALLVVMAVKMVDVWSLELLRKTSARSDSLVLWVVTLVTVVMDLVMAVGVGLTLAAFLFVRRQSSLGGSLLFADGRTLRSTVLRREAEEALLIRKGKEIRVVRIQGSLFFGSSDELMGRLEKAMEDASLIVLNMEGLRSLDLTGGRMLLDLLARWKERGVSLWWGGWSQDNRTGRFLRDLGLDAILPPERRRENLDRALEQAENELLARSRKKKDSLDLADLEFIKGLYFHEQILLKGLMSALELQDGDYLFHSGDEDRDLYFVLEGHMEVHGSANPEHRVAAYGPGQHLGLLSWLEQSPRTYTARAAGPVKLVKLADADLRNLLEAEPAFGLHLLQIWARQLAVRVRRFQDARVQLSEASRED